ncbi:MAG: Ig-like domain-containing protein [Anaerolineales bacterium]|nr:Ig-like domain-containing protein [Anaerolineales bacterium]
MNKKMVLRAMLIGLLSLIAGISLILTAPEPAQGADGLPSYQLQFLGSGSPVAINNNGTVVGARVISGSNYEPLVSISGAPWVRLPVPTGAVSVFPTDLNDSGVIIGVSYDAAFNAVAVRWLPSPGGYTVEILPRLPGDNSSYASGINNLGQIVGARGALGYVPAMTTGWLYSDQLGVVDLYAQYGWAIAPTELNDNGLVLGGTEQLNLNSGVISVLPPGPSNYYPITGKYINNHDQVAGYSSMRSSSLNIVSVYRYNPGAGWLFIAGTSKYTTVSSINNLGDVGYGELGTGIYLEGFGAYPLYTLLDPSVSAAGWTITGSGAKINDQRQIAANASNSITGEAGGALLIPAGIVQPPTAPVNLQGMAHYGTSSEPWNSIDLSWENTSSLTNSYELQRSEAGVNNWINLTLAVPPSASNTMHTDTTVGVGITYDYRVRAVGLAGPSLWSAVTTVTSPSVPLDTTPPVVSILTPADGASVTGTVVVTAQATDNVAVKYLEISYWNQYLGQEVILGSVENSGSLTVNWNTSGLTPASYAVWAYAYDAMGNWTQTEIHVNVSTTGKTMRVTSITLSGTARGSTANISGTIVVKDSAGKAVPSARVEVRWTLPNGSNKTAIGNTNSSGSVKFSTSGARGTYTLTVLDVSKTGYIFDAANSILTKSITK